MTIMKVSKVGEIIRVEVRNVSVKYYDIERDHVKSLIERFEYEKPSKLIINDFDFWAFSSMLVRLHEKGISIEDTGIVNYPKNEIKEKIGNVEFIKCLSINKNSNIYKLEVHTNDYRNLVDILLQNNYIISTTINNDKVIISIHGKS